jgi:hypothetical protein
MRFKWITTQLGVTALGALFTANAAMADNSASQAQLLQHHKPPSSELIRKVKDATRRFWDINQAYAEGYVEKFGCVSGSDSGAMGVHLVRFDLVFDPALDASKPELLLYEPGPNGSMTLTGADFLVLKADWEKAHPAKPGELPPVPELDGQLFHLFEAPNRFGLPDFYTLHVWAWKSNPEGAFVNWHPQVKCEQFDK